MKSTNELFLFAAITENRSWYWLQTKKVEEVEIHRNPASAFMTFFYPS